MLALEKGAEIVIHGRTGQRTHAQAEVGCADAYTCMDLCGTGPGTFEWTAAESHEFESGY